MNALEGKCALITGGVSGIGRATAKLFAEEGAALAIADIDNPGGEDLIKEIHATGGEAIFIHCDVTRAEDCQGAVEKAMQEYGRLDILFNNAGIIRRTNILEMSEAEWDLVMETNVKSVYLMSKCVLPVMIKAGGGSIINSGSGWGLRGGKNAVSYCASKGAVVNMTRAMAIDHGTDNIRVNCVCPGDTDTAMLRAEAQQVDQEIDSFLEEAADRPLGRYGKPIEIAQAVLYLASEASSYVTGTTLVVDGGGLA